MIPYADPAALQELVGYAIGAGAAIGALFALLSWLMPGVRSDE